MVFPNKDYITFSFDSTKPVNFTFPTKKPKKIWFDSGNDNISFRIAFNGETNGLLVHMSKNVSKEIIIPSTVNSVDITTTNEASFQLSILVEEWGN